MTDKPIAQMTPEQIGALKTFVVEVKTNAKGEEEFRVLTLTGDHDEFVKNGYEGYGRGPTIEEALKAAVQDFNDFMEGDEPDEEDDR